MTISHCYGSFKKIKMTKIVKPTYLFLLTLLLFACQGVENETENEQIFTPKDYVPKKYTLNEAHEIHEKFHEDKKSRNEFSHYLDLHRSEFMPHGMINRTGPVRELKYNLREDVANHRVPFDGQDVALSDYIDYINSDGFIILHKGEIVFEAYHGMKHYEKHHIYSCTKFFIGTTILMLEEEGLINLENTVAYYLPELAETAWGMVPIKDVLDMSSGMAGSMEFFWNDKGWPRFDELQPSPYDRLKDMKANRNPGEVYRYNDVNPQVLGWIIESVTGYSAFEYVQNRIWQKMGAEGDAQYLLSSGYNAVYMGTMSCTLRDLARFGLLFTPSGKDSPYDIISDRIIKKIQNEGRSEILENTGPIGLPIYDDPTSDDHLILGEAPHHISNQLDFVMNDGDFMKCGAMGQGLYISPDKDLVIAFMASERIPYHAIGRRLAISGLFE
jgi:CubicO group peptidase (beta-lactamase class C family)